eukprot:352677-Chlamydomonas_euryale.AAC.4
MAVAAVTTAVGLRCGRCSETARRWNRRAPVQLLERPPRLLIMPVRTCVARAQYVLPTDSPHLAKSFLDRAMSPMLWTRYGPDRFDMWSAGMVMMQLSLPPMRNDRGLSQFHKTVSSCGVRACTRVSQGKQSTHAPARCITGSVCSVGGEAGEGDGGADGQQAMRLRLRASLFRCSS